MKVIIIIIGILITLKRRDVLFHWELKQMVLENEITIRQLDERHEQWLASLTTEEREAYLKTEERIDNMSARDKEAYYNALRLDHEMKLRRKSERQ